MAAQHRRGTPGLCAYHAPRRSRWRRPVPRHAVPVPARSGRHTVGLIVLGTLLAMLLVSGWFAALGATAVAQMMGA